MNIQRVFTGSQDFKSLIIHQLEKEIEKIISATYNGKQVDIVATKHGRRQK
ncbi:hypothetical protein [Bacillus haynesii]|uniref:hypothetical protein n=1 Tax=Bacillus haynesii TaxID=1925021 RepID=UPI00228288D2|nr:hypothetical protein [Bacillus haynesii]MCY7912995.1 hypothetical protein [Bacillus haynesii]MCY7927202.1 hypothetical protein [Bacillus haynesii]MCY8758340.1 hypothetical protein [Bacillus haynesii]MCY8771897.1 hypothetical protein [Bacillus haynesii]MEC0789369.1 hypothetical protein [Bacillus haynesii]